MMFDEVGAYVYTKMFARYRIRTYSSQMEYTYDTCICLNKVFTFKLYVKICHILTDFKIFALLKAYEICYKTWTTLSI